MRSLRNRCERRSGETGFFRDLQRTDLVDSQIYFGQETTLQQKVLSISINRLSSYTILDFVFISR